MQTTHPARTPRITGALMVVLGFVASIAIGVIIGVMGVGMAGMAG